MAGLRTADLGVRTASALVMLALAAAAFWAGGAVFSGFAALVGLGVLWEWRALVIAFAPPGARRLVWLLAGVAYVGLATAALIDLRLQPFGSGLVLALVGAVIATDIGAYFAGRTIGGPKIAPRISPSKTWAGLGGGVLAASVWLFFANPAHYALSPPTPAPAAAAAAGQASYYVLATLPAMLLSALTMGTFIAVIAQSGDFFESHMKRRAGVKDSGRLIPGHGGLFDRVDGLIAVLFVIGLIFAAARLMLG